MGLRRRHLTGLGGRYRAERLPHRLSYRGALRASLLLERVFALTREANDMRRQASTE